MIRGIALMAALLFAGLVPAAYAHFDHFSHYNGRGEGIGQYYIYEALEPDYAKPGDPTNIKFSVQDLEGRDTFDIQTMVEIYASDGQRLHVFPWTKQDIGDFDLYYTFPQVGNYHIVLSIANGPVSVGAADPPRSALTSTLNCNCERVIFNVSITEGFGTIYTGTLVVAILAPLAVLGFVLGMSYRDRKKRGKVTGEEVLKYAVMLSAIAGGLVHFAVYSDHASLRLEYSIFLIVAGGAQIAYGVMYILLTMTAEASGLQSRGLALAYYRKTVIINLFGLIGTAVLLGLYAYVVVFPPPLSPNQEPEEVELAGILAKSVEVFLVVGILYLMRWEKRRMQITASSKT